MKKAHFQHLLFPSNQVEFLLNFDYVFFDSFQWWIPDVRFFKMYIGKLKRYFKKKIKTDFNGEEFNFRTCTSELVFLSTKN